MARYITSFSLPCMDKNIIYPYNVLAPKKLRNIGFEPITIFYGSNGSGKSTLLNIIARKIDIEMKDHNPTDVCKVQDLESIKYYKELMDKIYKS